MTVYDSKHFQNCRYRSTISKMGHHQNFRHQIFARLRGHGSQRCLYHSNLVSQMQKLLVVPLRLYLYTSLLNLHLSRTFPIPFPVS